MNDCRLASGWGLQVGMSYCCWYCKKFVMGEGGTGSWVVGEWEGVVEEGGFLRWLGSGVVEE